MIIQRSVKNRSIFFSEKGFVKKFAKINSLADILIQTSEKQFDK